jgi:hypothetical protein
MTYSDQDVRVPTATERSPGTLSGTLFGTLPFSQSGTHAGLYLFYAFCASFRGSIYRLTPADRHAFSSTWSSIWVVSRPVKVFC